MESNINKYIKYLEINYCIICNVIVKSSLFSAVGCHLDSSICNEISVQRILLAY